MIVDCHTHIPVSKHYELAGIPVGEFLSQMDRFGVDVCWLFTIDGFVSDYARENDHLLAYVEGYGHRLLPFCTVEPRHGKRAADEIRRSVRELGMRGVKLHPWLQGFSPVELCMEVLAGEAMSLGVPIVFHDGTPPYSTPLQIAYLAERFPELTVVLGHSGLLDMWQEAIWAAKRCQNIYLIPSGCSTLAMAKMVELLGPERLLFGTDAGFGDWQMVEHRLGQVQSLALTQEERELILGGNATRLVPIAHPSE